MLSLKLELFNDDIFERSRIDQNYRPHKSRYYHEKIPRPWVARIFGFDPVFGYKREFLKFNRDYSEAKGMGSRGVYLYYHLDENEIYEVKEQLSWNKWNRFFCRVKNNQIEHIDEAEVRKCQKNTSE